MSSEFAKVVLEKIKHFRRAKNLCKKTESHLAYEKSMAVLHAKSYDHNDRISILENYFKSTNPLATN